MSNMRIFVKIGEPLWRAVGSRSLTLEWNRPSVTVGEALERLQQKYPAFEPAFRGQDQRLTLKYCVFVNSRLVEPETWAHMALRDADKLFIFLPAVGG